MNVQDIKIGTKLNIELYNESYEKIPSTFYSKLEAVKGNESVIIYAPMSEGRLYPVHIGWDMNISFVKNQNLFGFQTKIINRIILDNLTFLEAKVNSDIVKIQRREYFRLSYTQVVEYRLISSVNNSDISSYKEAYATDISGGGLCLKVGENIKINDVLECKLNIDDNGDIKFLGKVVRLGERDEELIYPQELGIKFLKIDRRDIDRIVRFIFEKQRSLRRKELI